MRGLRDSPVLFAVLDDGVAVCGSPLTTHVRVSPGHTARHRIALQKHMLSSQVSFIFFFYSILYNINGFKAASQY